MKKLLHCFLCVKASEINACFKNKIKSSNFIYCKFIRYGLYCKYKETVLRISEINEEIRHRENGVNVSEGSFDECADANIVKLIIWEKNDMISKQMLYSEVK